MKKQKIKEEIIKVGVFHFVHRKKKLKKIQVVEWLHLF